MADEKEIKPISALEAKAIADKEKQKVLEQRIFRYTELLNGHIISATKSGYKLIFLFEFYALPDKNPQELLDQILSDNDSWPEIVRKDDYDPNDYFDSRKAFVKALKSFEQLGYKIGIKESNGWNEFLVKTKKLFHKPKYYLRNLLYERPWIANAIGTKDPEKLKAITTTDRKWHYISLKSYNVYLTWD